jgi:hypothetical protein
LENKSEVQKLLNVSDELILEEAARRLKTQFEKDNRRAFMYGSFRFLFHDGRFQGVEDWPRNKRYQSPRRNSKNEDF